MIINNCIYQSVDYDNILTRIILMIRMIKSFRQPLAQSVFYEIKLET